MGRTRASVIVQLLFASGELDQRLDTEEQRPPVRQEWLCQRPSLPPVFFLAATLWAGVAVTVDSLYGAKPSICWDLGVLAAVISCASLVILARLQAFAGCILLGAALGCAIGSFHALAMVESAQELIDRGEGMQVQLVRDSREGAYGRSAVGMTSDGCQIHLNLGEGDRLMVGDVAIIGACKRPNARVAYSHWQDGIVAVASAGAAKKLDMQTPIGAMREFRRAAIESTARCGRDAGDGIGIPLDDAVTMLCAMAMGYTDGLYTSALYQAVKVDGLAHLVAVSGTHLSLVCGMVAIAFRRFALPRVGGILTQCLFIIGYLVFTGAPTSAVRAAMMTSIGMLSFFSKRRSYALGGLSCCVILMIAGDPAAAFSPSLLLSATATAGIVIFSGYFDGILGRGLRIPAGLIRDSAALTVAASVVSGPISAYLYAQVSLVSIIANLAITPLVPFICAGGTLAVASAVAVPFVGAGVLGASLIVLHGVCAVLDALSWLPGAAFPVSIQMECACVMGIGIPVALWIAWPRPCAAMAILCVAAVSSFACLSLAMPYMRGDAITMLDVGQGDAILLQSKGRSLLIDTGTEDVALLEGLAACGIRSLDAVLITHPDDDHCGSLKALRGIVNVNEVLVAHDLLYERNGHCTKLREAAASIVGESGIRGLSVGECIEVGAMHCAVAGPDVFADGGGNADSLVLTMGADVDGDGDVDCAGLFCGDAEEPQISRYVGEGRIGDIDILKVGHHGSRDAVDASLLNVLRPEVSLIGVGAQNRYGHPVPQTVELLEKAGSKVYRTDEDGMITCFLRSDGIQVVSAR